MFKKRINLKVLIETLKIMAPLTASVVVIGFLFGTILERVFLGPISTENASVEATVSYPNNNQSNGIVSEVENISSTDEATQEDVIYVMQIGVFETLDNALALIGTLGEKGFTRGVNHIDGRFYVFSHIVGEREQLLEVETEMRQRGIEPFVRVMPVPTEDLRWYYFLKAVRQIPYEMDSEFIQMFTTDELHIFGLYGTLASVSFEPLSSERQEILLEIYNWLRD